MRAVIDTNVLLSGLLWHGAPHLLLEHVRNGVVTLLSSPALMAELDRDWPAMLALASAAQADCVVSGDDDLLSLHSFQGIAIVTPAQALNLVQRAL